MVLTHCNAWPSLDPPLLKRLPRPPPHPDPASLPPSQRYRSSQFPTLQDEVDQIDWEEDQWLQSQHDSRMFGYTWLVPLGRQNTQEEDAESVYSSSPRPTSPLADEADQTLDEGAPPVDLDADIEDADASGVRSSAGEEEDDDEEEEDDEAAPTPPRSASEAGTDSFEVDSRSEADVTMDQSMEEA